MVLLCTILSHVQTGGAVEGMEGVGPVRGDVRDDESVRGDESDGGWEMM